MTKKSTLEVHAEIFRSAGWFYPAYTQRKYVGEMAHKIRDAKPEAKDAALCECLNGYYTAGNMVPRLLYRYARLPATKDFTVTIAEALHAYYLGLMHVATASLAPIVEGIIRRIAQRKGAAIGDREIKKKLLATIDQLIADQLEHDAKYGGSAGQERSTMLNAFRAFIVEDFWQNTSKFNHPRGLNRHKILHGVSGDGTYAARANFQILISVVDLLAFIDTYSTAGISVMAPRSTHQSDQLVQLLVGLLKASPLLQKSVALATSAVLDP